MEFNPFYFDLNHPSPSIPLITKSLMWKIILLAFKSFTMPLLSFICPLLNLIFLSYIELVFVHPVTNHECGVKCFHGFWLFSSKNPLYLVFQAFLWIFMILGKLIHMTCILSTPGVVETWFWPLSSLDIELFRATFVFTYFFLCWSSGPIIDQSSQFVPNSGLHVAGEMKICFRTIILKGVNLIVNKT